MNDAAQVKDHGEYQAARLPIVAEIARDYDVEPRDWRVLTEQIFPSAKSVGSILLALAYCQRRQLDIFKRPVHIVPMWSSEKKGYVETVWPGISEVRTTAARTGQYAGIDEIEFGKEIEEEFKGTIKERAVTKKVKYPEWAKAVVYRMVAGQRCAFHAKVFWKETYATIGRDDLPNEMWETRPYGQLAKCAEAAALRMAFPEEIGSEYTAEEMAGKTIDVTPQNAPIEAPPAPKVEIQPTPKQEVTPPDPKKSKGKRERDATPYAAEKAQGDFIELETSEVLDPDKFLDDLDGQLAVAKDAETLAEVWAEYLGVLGDLMPPDKDKAAEMLAKHEKRLGL